MYRECVVPNRTRRGFVTILKRATELFLNSLGEGRLYWYVRGSEDRSKVREEANVTGR